MYFYQILMREKMNFKILNIILGTALVASAGLNVYLYNEKKRISDEFENYIETSEGRINEYEEVINTLESDHEAIMAKHEQIAAEVENITQKLDNYIKEEEAAIEKSADIDDPVEPTGGIEYVEDNA